MLNLSTFVRFLPAVDYIPFYIASCLESFEVQDFLTGLKIFDGLLNKFILFIFRPYQFWQHVFKGHLPDGNVILYITSVN